MKYLTPAEEGKLLELFIGGYPINSAIVEIEQIVEKKITEDRLKRKDCTCAPSS